MSDNIFRPYQSMAQLRKLAAAWETIFETEPVVRLSGVFRNVNTNELMILDRGQVVVNLRGHERYPVIRLDGVGGGRKVKVMSAGAAGVLLSEVPDATAN
jgi:hypothetical protein